MNITVFTGCTDAYWSLMQLTCKNRSEYCKRHGYILALHKFPCSDNLHLLWERSIRTIEFLNKCDYLLFMGVDTCFTNMTVKIESLLEKYSYPDIIIGEDINGINNDVIIYKNCQQVLEWLATILINTERCWSDQNAMDEALKNFPEVKCKKIHQKEINAMPYWLYDYPDHKGGQWEQGDYIFHAPALPLEKRIEVITEVLRKVVG